MKKRKLTEFGSNVHSQSGEDGIIQKIMELIGEKSRSCIEFGAWDGFHLSNTARMWTNGWKAVLIEGEPSRFETLKSSVKDYDCLPLSYFVGIDPGEDSLEFILKKHGVSFDVDVLSIDIDGNDYYILESLGELRPRVIICEYNPTIPYYMDVFGKYGNHFGCSLGALNRLAESMRYRIVAVTDTNAFLVQESLSGAFADFETDIEKIALTKYYNHVITNYSGDYLVEGRFSYGLGDPISLREPLNFGPGRELHRREDLRLEGTGVFSFFREHSLTRRLKGKIQALGRMAGRP